MFWTTPSGALVTCPGNVPVSPGTFKRSASACEVGAVAVGVIRLNAVPSPRRVVLPDGGLTAL